MNAGDLLARVAARDERRVYDVALVQRWATKGTAPQTIAGIAREETADFERVAMSRTAAAIGLERPHR